MMDNFKLKHWESDFFNRPIYELSSIVGVSDWPENSLIAVNINSADNLSLNFANKHDFDFCEGNIVFEKTIERDNTREQLTCFSAYLADEGSVDALKSLVSGLYINSRFKEPWFTEAERDCFYKKWVEKAALGEFDDCCLILKIDNLISGFVTIRIRNKEATIGLIGVTKAYRGKGIAKDLLYLVEGYCRSHGAYKIMVGTQASNVSAVNLYCKSGFSMSNISYWFYKKV